MLLRRLQARRRQQLRRQVRLQSAAASGAGRSLVEALQRRAAAESGGRVTPAASAAGPLRHDGGVDVARYGGRQP